MIQQQLADTTLSGMVAGTFSGALQGGTLTDGTATLPGSATGLVPTLLLLV